MPPTPPPYPPLQPPPLAFAPPPKPVRPCDPIAAAVGNASLLAVGYVLLRRPIFAVANWVVTILLVVLLVTVERPGWVQILTLLVWAAVTVHGWIVATRQNRRAAEAEPTGPTRSSQTLRQRLISGGVALAVVLALAGLRLDASRIEQAAADAHRADRCEQARETLDGLWAGHRLVAPTLVNQDAPESLAACGILLRAERRAAAGDRVLAAETLEQYREHPAALWKGAADRRADLLVDQAGTELRTGLNGDTNVLGRGFDHLSTVLKESPGHAPDVAKVVDGFVSGLPVKDPCVTTRITDWLGTRTPAGNELDRAVGVVARIAPAAILGCGDQYMGAKDPDSARNYYRQLLDRYPSHQLAPKAKQGERKATLAIQLTKVSNLLGEQTSNGVPLYCSEPAAYGGAPPYRGRGKGPYRTLLYGQDGHRKQLPVSWRAKGPTDAVLVVCAGDLTFGTIVDTCQYSSEDNDYFFYEVNFHKRKIPVRVYELRTGKLVRKTSVQIDGSSCPSTLWGDKVLGPDHDQYVSSSAGNVRAGYKPLIDP